MQEGETPLLCCCSVGGLAAEIVRLLLKLRCDPEAKGKVVTVTGSVRERIFIGRCVVLYNDQIN